MKYSIEKINQALQNDWLCISDTYSNLESELTFRCDKGHEFVSTWKKIRDKQDCPICLQEKYKQNSSTIKPFTKKKGNFRVIALDQATYTTGYSIFDNKNLVTFGTYTVSGEEIERDHKIKDWLYSLIQAWDPDYVALEGIQYQQYSGVTTFETLARLQGILLELCFELNIPVKVCHTSKWRSYCGVTGKARADKKRSAQLNIKNWYNIDADEDSSDAICIGRYASAQVTPQIEYAF